MSAYAWWASYGDSVMTVAGFLCRAAVAVVPLTLVAVAIDRLVQRRRRRGKGK